MQLTRNTVLGGGVHGQRGQVVFSDEWVNTRVGAADSSSGTSRLKAANASDRAWAGQA
jgi:hypothetical protein